MSSFMPVLFLFLLSFFPLAPRLSPPLCPLTTPLSHFCIFRAFDHPLEDILAFAQCGALPVLPFLCLFFSSPHAQVSFSLANSEAHSCMITFHLAFMDEL